MLPSEKQKKKNKPEDEKQADTLKNTSAVSPLLSTYLGEKEFPSAKRKKKPLIKNLMNNHGFPTK